MRHILGLGALVVAAVCGGPIGDLSALSQEPTRTIRYDPAVSIPDRLLAGDVNVIVTKGPWTPQGRAPNQDTFEETIRRLASYNTAAVSRISEAQGLLVDGNTWIRTRFRAQAIDMVKAGPLMDHAGHVEFWQDGGRVQLGSVTVSAGIFVEFHPQQEYLLFFRTDPGRGTTYAAQAFRVDSKRVLQPVTRHDGSTVYAATALFGRTVSEVTAALAQAQ